MIPVNEPKIAKSAQKYLLDCIKTGWISSAGEYISKFEKAFANYLGIKHAITVSNGTASLHLALATLGIGKNDEIIIPSHTMIACAFAVCYLGAKPVFVDVERDTWNMNVNLIEKKITKRTKAIMPVHIYGHPADMDPLLALAKKYKIFVIEDSAEAHGAEYKHKKTGTIGKINCFSFYGNKIITTGEGGMVVTNDDKLAKKARSLKDLSHSSHKRFLHDDLGYNYRMTNMQAAVGLAQMEEIDSYLEKKAWMANTYNKLLSSIKGLTLPIEKKWAKNVYWMYGMLIEDEFGLNRDELVRLLKKKGVDTRTFFIPMHRQPALINRGLILKSEKFPVSDDIANRGLYLPSGLAITKSQIEIVCETIRTIQKRHAV